MKFVLYNVTGTDTAENIYLPGIAQPDYNDVRFALSDGTPLDYWMETPTGTDHAIFWVKVPSIPQGPENTVAIDIYYGNSTIGSGANGDATFPLFDDFDGSSLNTTKWTSVYSGTPNVSNSILTLPSYTGIQSNAVFNSNASLRFHGNLYGYPHRVGFYDASDTTDYAYVNIQGSARNIYIYTGVNSTMTDVVSLETTLPDQYKTMEFSWNSTSLSLQNETGTVGSVARPVIATLPVVLRTTTSSTRTNYYDWVFVRQLADTEPAAYQPETVPAAGFSADVTNGDAPLRVRFTDTSTGMPTTWAWDFDSDGTVDSTAPNPTYTYSVPGTYTVTLTVTNAAGSTTETKTALITVTTPPPPTAGFSADSVTGSAPFTVAFTDESSGIVTAWAWDFDSDGTVDSTAPNPTYTYSVPGTYTVTLTVTNAGGSDQVTKTDYITVEEAGPGPVAAFTANTTSGTAPLTVAFTDESTGTITDWAWDFNNDGVTDATTQDANHTYAAPGTYSVNLTVTGPDGSDNELKTNFITVTAPDADLIVSAGPPSDFSPSPNLFARYTANTVSATITNSGTQSVGPFNVTFDVDGNVTSVSVAGLGAGNSTVVTTTDTVDRQVNASVPIIITADAEGAVVESNETNNVYSYNATVIYNGYAGHRWSSGDDLTTKRILNIQGDMIYSLGDSEYGSDSVSWTASDLPIPAGATVKDARLYVPYTWDWQGNMLGTTTMTFNGVVIPHDAHYREQKNWGAWGEYAYGVFIFNVTDQFNANENNNAVFSHGYAPVRGMNLVVTYEDANATAKQIFINEGFDMLFARSDFYTTPETATAYAPFTGAEIDIDRVQSADLITSVSRLSARGIMLFNGQEWASYWAPGRGEIGINTTDITPYLSANDNTVMFRSSGEELGIEAYLAILKVEYRGEATVPAANFTANVTSGTAPLTVQFNDTSTGFPTSWAWEFGDGAIADQKDPVHTYTAAGTYTVNLTAANAAGSDTEVKIGYITVTGTGPSLPWQDPCESLDEWTHTGCMLSDTVVYEGSHSINGRAALSTVSAERTIVIPAGATELRFNAAATTSYLMTSWVKVYLDGEEKHSIPIPTAVDWNRYAIDLAGLEPGPHNFTIAAYSGSGWAPVDFYLDNIWVIGDEEVLSTVTVTPAEAELEVGETTTFSAEASTQYGERLTETTFTWSSSNEAVGTVNETGYFTALGAGTATVTAAAGNVNGTALVTVTGGSPGGDLPDLVVSTLASNNGEVFSAAENIYTAKITNIGTADAGAFAVEFNVSGTTGTVAVDGLAAGANTTVTWTDETIRNAGDAVTITAVADPDGLIGESNEENNLLSIERTVVHNGYRGKRWTDGEDIATAKTYDVRGDLLWSAGDGAYLSAGTNWADYTVNWTASDLTVPEGATIAGARLYVPYTWDKGPVFPENVALTFNGAAVEQAAFYEDEKGWGTSYPYGMTVYNVTDAFSPEGNTAVLTNTFPGGGNVSVRGMLLAVVYDDGTTSPHTVLMNEGFDLLYGGEAQGTTPEQATAYAPFTLDPANATGARLVTVAPGAGPNEGELIFNGETWTNVWNYTGTSQIGVDERNVTSLLAGENVAAFQSSADYMEAAAAFLIVEYAPEPGSILVTSTPTGAAVWLDGEDTGQVTPITLTNVPAGDHVVTVKLDGYADASMPVTVATGETAEVDLELTTLTGSLTVTSTPEGAAILIDGADTGEVTNATIDEIGVGDHTVTLRKDGYRDATAEVTIIEDETATLHLDLIEAAGSIAVASTPTGAAIWLDGIDTGMTTNAILENVAAGEHTVTVKKAGYADASATVAVADDEIATVSFTLTAPAGSIVVTSAPDGARIVLDGAETGETTNATLTNVPVGTHTVRVSLDGYLETEETVTVASGEIASVHFDLDAAAITLQPGWNFVSTPKQLADGQDTIAIFDGVDTAGRPVLLYNGTSQWEAMSREEAFRPLDGVWIYANTSYTIPLVFAAGSISTPPTKDLDEGWNAIGFSDTVPETAANTLRSVEPAWAMLFGWKANEQAYDVSIIRGATGRHGETRELFPTQGYWLYMNDADTLAAIGA